MNNDFTYSLPDFNNDNQEEEYQKILEKEIEAQCGIVYKDKPETKKEITDEELLQKTKEEIIQYKNSQIMELKSYIASLEQEKDDLIDNFKDTTNLLLEKIKDLEANKTGFRPETPMITKNLRKKTGGVTPNDFSSISTNNSIQPQKKEKIQHCPNCGQYFPDSEFLNHSLQCLRKVFHCKACGSLVDESKKSQHLKEFRAPKLMITSITKNDEKMFEQCISHGFNINKELETSTGNYPIHIICKNNKIKFLEKIIDILSKKNELKVKINILNKSKETPLSIALSNKAEACALYLINKGADVSLRNSSDASPLMVSCKYGLTNMVKELINHGANPNEKNILGDTPLKIAQMNGHSELAMILISNYKVKIN